MMRFLILCLYLYGIIHLTCSSSDPEIKYEENSDEILSDLDDKLPDEGFETKESESEDFLVGEINTLHNIPDCSGPLNKRLPIVLVSTLDGKISGIDYSTGKILWSHEIGLNGSPLVSSSMSYIEVTSDGKVIRLIPSLEGQIYKFDGENVEPLPFTADSLLQSSFKLNDETIFTGGKFSEVLGLLPYDGDIKYFCDSTGCPQRKPVGDNNQVLVVRKISRTIRAIDAKTGSESWNFSVGVHDVNVASTGCDSLAESIDSSLLPSLHFVLPTGVVIAMDSDDKVLWKQKLPTPIVSAWSLVNGDLHHINVFSSAFVPALVRGEYTGAKVGQSEQGDKEAALYVGVHKDQIYIQRNHNVRSHLTLGDYHLGSSASDSKVSVKILWEPYMAGASSLTPLSEADSRPTSVTGQSEGPGGSEGEISKELAIRHSENYGIDSGFYLFSEEIQFSSNYSFSEEFIEDVTFPEQIYYLCIKLSPTFWWTILALVLTYCAIHAFVFRFLFNIVVNDIERDTNRRIVNVISILLHNILREHPQLLAVVHRIGVNLPQLPPAKSSTVLGKFENGSVVAIDKSDGEEQFVSRYVSDFEPIRCLGKGGFGVVFRVRNKLDQNEYAVKRIVLPSKESSAERVKREVRALAKLSHPSIVRYYNSWMETPPLGWLQKADSWWTSNDTMSPFMSNAEERTSALKSPSEINSSNQISNRQKELSLSGLVQKLTPNQISCDKTNDISCSKMELSSFYSGDLVSFPSSRSASSIQSSVNDDSTKDSDLSCDQKGISYNKQNLGNFQSNSLSLDSSFDVVFRDDSSKLDASSRHSILSSSAKNQVESREVSLSDSRSLNLNATHCLSDSSRSLSTLAKSGMLAGNFGKFSNKRRTKSEKLHTENNEDIVKLIRPISLDLSKKTDDSRAKILKDDQLRGKLSPSPTNTPSNRTFLYIQMELCHDESLKDWLFRNHDRNPQVLFSLFNDIVHAVEFVHDQCLMHRDLKPSNIFFSLGGDVKIGDFGLVTSIEDEPGVNTPGMESPSNVGPLKSSREASSQRTVHAGTHLYMSPEQILGKSYTYKVDIFSLGLILFELLVPFSTEMERRDVMTNARSKNFPQGFCQKFPHVAQLLELALHTEPNERPTTRGIRARPPLDVLQKDLTDILPDDHFRLSRSTRIGHARSHSGSFSAFHSSTSSTSLS